MPNIEDKQKSYPDTGKSSAVNAAKKLKLWNFAGATEAYAQMSKYACSYFVLDDAQMVENFKLSNKQALIKVIQDVMTDYYTTTDPAIAEDVFNQVLNIIIKSARAYSAICFLFKLQDLRNFKDEDDLKLAGLLGNWTFQEFTDAYYNAHQGYVETIEVDNALNAGLGAMGISNADWSNKILQNLQTVYLNDAIREQLEFSFISTFKFRRDDATVRFATIIPYDVQYNLPPTIANTLDKWVDLIKGYTDSIIASKNAYPFITTILNMIGLTPGSKYDFTRDLKGQTLHVYDDFYGDVEASLYSVSIADHETFNLALDDSDCIISEPEFVAHFKDNNLSYSDRVFFDVVSWTNLIRGSIYGLTLHTITQVRLRKENLYKQYLVVAPMYHVIVVDSNAQGNDVSKVCALMAASQWAAVTDAVVGCHIAVASYINNTWMFDISVHLGLADYVFNDGDYEPIISQASYDLVFSATPNEYLRSYITNTINTSNTN